MAVWHLLSSVGAFGLQLALANFKWPAVDVCELELTLADFNSMQVFRNSINASRLELGFSMFLSRFKLGFNSRESSKLRVFCPERGLTLVQVRTPSR